MLFDFKYKISNSVDGVFEILPNSFKDLRGEIWTSFHKNTIKTVFNINAEFIHDKFVSNKEGVLRGLHGDFSTYKLVSCPVGEVFQVALDMRTDSITYGKYHTLLLNEENKKSLLLPPGVVNGFLVLSKFSLYSYKLAYTGNYKDFDEQFTVMYNDIRFNIPWPTKKIIVSERDDPSK